MRDRVGIVTVDDIVPLKNIKVGNPARPQMFTENALCFFLNCVRVRQGAESIAQSHKERMARFALPELLLQSLPLGQIVEVTDNAEAAIGKRDPLNTPVIRLHFPD